MFYSLENSTKEITRLRKEGELKAALQLVMKCRKNDPDDVGLLTALFWVYYDLAKAQLVNDASANVESILIEMERLLPIIYDDEGIAERSFKRVLYSYFSEGREMLEYTKLSKEDPQRAFYQIKKYVDGTHKLSVLLHENLGWILYRYLKSCSSELSSVDIRRVLFYYIKLENPRSSLLHSMILNFAVAFSKKYADFKLYSFLKLWGIDKFRIDDLIEKQSADLFNIVDSKKKSYQDRTKKSLLKRLVYQLVYSSEEVDIKSFAEELYNSILQIEGTFWSGLSLKTISDIYALFQEAYFWRLYNISKNGNINPSFFGELNTYNNVYAHLGASHWNSEVLALVNRTLVEENLEFISFFKAWGIYNFSSEDWKERTDKAKNVYPSLASQVAKRCYDTIISKHCTKENLLWLRELYDEVLSHLKGDVWSQRKRAQIAIYLSDYESAIAIYKLLLREINDKYYIWSELASCIIDDIGLRIGLLSKALLLEKNEKFLGAIHLALAELLIDEGLSREALTELNRYKIYHERLSSTYLKLQNRIDDTVQPFKSNKLFYIQHAAKAEEFAYSDIEFKEVALVNKWQSKKNEDYLTFSDGVSLSFVVKVKRFPYLRQATLGSVYKVKCIEKESRVESLFSVTSENRAQKDRQYTPLLIRKTEAELWSSLPLRYGYVEYDNSKKNVLHILAQSSEMVFYRYMDEAPFSKGDFVTFRTYPNKRGTAIVDLKLIDKKIALQHFPNCKIVIDNVNQQKKLFHYATTSGNFDGIVFFKDIKFIPYMSQELRISYVIPKNNGSMHSRPVVLDIKSC